MLKEISNTTKKISGTAGEALDVSVFNGMVKKYGKETALGMLKPTLEKAGENVDTFTGYLRVKSKIQNNTINIPQAKATAEEEINAVFPDPENSFM